MLFMTYFKHKPHARINRQYVKKMRLHKATTLIIAGESVTQAAYNVGYVSLSQFSKHFKKHFGVPPSEARIWQPGEAVSVDTMPE